VELDDDDYALLYGRGTSWREQVEILCPADAREGRCPDEDELTKRATTRRENKLKRRMKARTFYAGRTHAEVG
jgi:hypothetical protein